MVVRDESVKGISDGYPVYTEAELGELCQDGVNEATLRLVHEAKKLAGAKVTMKLRTLVRWLTAVGISPLVRSI